MFYVFLVHLRKKNLVRIIARFSISNLVACKKSSIRLVQKDRRISSISCSYCNLPDSVLCALALTVFVFASAKILHFMQDHHRPFCRIL